MSNINSQLRNWERWNDFQRWQSAQTLRLLFGDNHLQKQPILPVEYEPYAKVWLDREATLVNQAIEEANKNKK